MTRTEVAIGDIAEALLGFDNIKLTRAQKLAIYKRSLEGLCSYAVNEYVTAQTLGVQNDLAKIAEIQEGSKKA